MKLSKTKKTLLTIIPVALLLAGYAYALRPIEAYQVVDLNVKKAKVVELPMTDWVLNEFEKNGLNKYVAFCVIMTESRFNPDAISPTKDFGLMQWNIQHIKSGLISLHCSADYKCAVAKAIEKIKKDKSWSAWMGYKNANCGMFGKTFN